jgi:hypothetical protein
MNINKERGVWGAVDKNGTPLQLLPVPRTNIHIYSTNNERDGEEKGIDAAFSPRGQESTPIV